MPAREPIGVTVHLPTSKEGMERLRERLIEVNSDILAAALNAIDAPREVKVAYIRSLGGLAPGQRHERSAQAPNRRDKSMYLIEYQPPTALNRWRHRRRLRKMAEEVLPRSRDWVLVLAGIAVWAVFLTLFVGWWTA